MKDTPYCRGAILILRKNDILDVTIESTGYEGEGIAKIDGYPLFVRNAAEGDVAKIRILKANKNFGFAKIEQIISPSPYRRDAACPSFGKCGGCNMMHIDYDRQLLIKENTVKNNLRKIAHLEDGDYKFEGIIGGDEYNYRNKAQFPLAFENGKAVYGFYAPGSHRVVKCDTCRIQNEKINRIADAVLDYINENGVSIYDEKTHKGLIRHIYVRVSSSGDAMVTVVVNGKKKLPFEEKLIEKVTAIDGVTGILQNVNTRTDNIIMGRENILIWGDKNVALNLGD